MGKLVPSEIARLIAAQRRMEPRACVVCGTEVIGTVRRRYCSTVCRQRAAYARRAEQHRAKRRQRYSRQREQARSDE